MVLVGPSGCGKTTTLHMVAGLESITKGEVRIGDRVVNDVPPKERDIAMVFQNYALYPQMSVFDNMAFGLKLQKVSRSAIDRRVRDAARILDLDELVNRKPRALSGGSASGSPWVGPPCNTPRPSSWTSCCPTSTPELRVQMRAEIARLQHELAVTTIYVTHDQIEAITMGDRVAVIREGRLQQVDSPEELYERPRKIFVAGFIGSPAMNLLEASLARPPAGWTGWPTGVRRRPAWPLPRRRAGRLRHRQRPGPPRGR